MSQASLDASQTREPCIDGAPCSDHSPLKCWGYNDDIECLSSGGETRVRRVNLLLQDPQKPTRPHPIVSHLTTASGYV